MHIAPSLKHPLQKHGLVTSSDNFDLEAATIVGMLFAIWGMRILEAMFFVGLVGSSVVVLISFVEDAKELVGEE